MTEYKILPMKADDVFVLIKLENEPVFKAAFRERSIKDALLKVAQLEGISIEVCDYPTDEIYKILQ